MTPYCTCLLTEPCTCGYEAALEESSMLNGGWRVVADPDRPERS